MNEAIAAVRGTHPTPADFRAEIARRQLRLYDLAPHVGMHPTKLGAVLNERAPLTPAVAARLSEAIATATGDVEKRSAVR